VSAQPDDFSNPEARKIFEASKNMTAAQRAAFLKQLEARRAREKILGRYNSAADLARSIDPTYRITPAIDLIAESMERVIRSPKPLNLMVSMPPQEGKSTLVAVFGTLRALQLQPNHKVVLACYGSDLAHTHSRKCRELINTYGSGLTDGVSGAAIDDKIGLRLKKGSNQVKEWGIEGHEGGLVAAGIGAAITGRRADLFIIDDPYKNMVEADSATIRRKVDEWFASVVTTRLTPSAGIILIQTRWHPEDISGSTLAGEREVEAHERSWRYINIPAVSEDGIPDALNRPTAGIAMESARDGHDADGNEIKRDFPTIRRKVGERVWYALYQGSPRNPAGGLFLRSWFDERRLDAAPIIPVVSIVAIDPADSGEGDETGIIAASLAPDGKIVLTEDWSGQMTSDQWARQAVTLALQLGAREIKFEGYTTAKTYKNVILGAYRDMRDAAIAKHNQGAVLTPIEQRSLSQWPPFTVSPWTGKGDAVARSALLRQACEVGTCVTVAHKLAVFEDQACDWQAGQHQPDRVAAAIIAHDRLRELGNGAATLAAPVSERPGANTPAWLRRRITDK